MTSAAAIVAPAKPPPPPGAPAVAPPAPPPAPLPAPVPAPVPVPFPAPLSASGQRISSGDRSIGLAPPSAGGGLGSSTSSAWRERTLAIGRGIDEPRRSTICRPGNVGGHRTQPPIDHDAPAVLSPGTWGRQVRSPPIGDGLESAPTNGPESSEPAVPGCASSDGPLARAARAEPRSTLGAGPRLSLRRLHHSPRLDSPASSIGRHCRPVHRRDPEAQRIPARLRNRQRRRIHQLEGRASGPASLALATSAARRSRKLPRWTPAVRGGESDSRIERSRPPDLGVPERRCGGLSGPLRSRDDGARRRA